MKTGIQLPRRLFTVEEYHRMTNAGVLSEGDRVELIHGEIVRMTPIGARHAACVARLTALFSRLHQKSIVWVQNPIRLQQHSEPQPDLSLLRLRSDFYDQAHPTGEDVLLVVEVAETSEDYDRAIKVPLYCREGIPEVWLVDLSEEIIEVYVSPSSHGYKEVRRFARGQRVSPQAFPSPALTVDDVIG
jgi:Uma2 family endonuclease